MSLRRDTEKIQYNDGIDTGMKANYISLATAAELYELSTKELQVAMRHYQEYCDNMKKSKTNTIMNNELEVRELDANDLVNAVLEWWEEHQYDTVGYDTGAGYPDEKNVYDEKPKFVEFALYLKGDGRQ